MEATAENKRTTAKVWTKKTENGSSTENTTSTGTRNTNQQKGQVNGTKNTAGKAKYQPKPKPATGNTESKGPTSDNLNTTDRPKTRRRPKSRATSKPLDSAAQNYDNTLQESQDSTRGKRLENRPRSSKGRGRGRGRGDTPVNTTQEIVSPSTPDTIIQINPSDSEKKPTSRGRGRGRGSRGKINSNLKASAREFVPRDNSTTINSSVSNSNNNTSNSRNHGYQNKRDNSTRKFSNKKADDSTKEKPVVFKLNRNKRTVEDVIDVKHTEHAAEIIQQLKTDTYDCIICTERIRRTTRIWNCENCYKFFHFSCIDTWCKKDREMHTRPESRTPTPSTVLTGNTFTFPPAFSGQSNNNNNNNNAQQKKNESKMWRCPHCNKERKENPVSKCFCGKVVDPEFDPYIVPHSCDQKCGRKRVGTGCPHVCQLKCHPGPCPPCGEITGKKCFCEKLDYQIGCGSRDPGKSCGEKCMKLLNCERHDCEDVCHAGKCENCQEIIEMTCYCGKTKENRVCGTDDPDYIEINGEEEERHFGCEQDCERTLECGKHNCDKKCHKGTCGPCKLSIDKIKTCPCGKMQIGKEMRKSCSEPIPVCGKICDKMLECGMHRCKENCHLGSCGGCVGEQEVYCRCGAETTIFKCKQVINHQTKIKEGIENIHTPLYLCTRTCQDKRDCGRHVCAKKCCEGGGVAHNCPLECKKKLTCGKHKCKKNCHKGRCSPCMDASFDELTCACGKTIMYPPIPCGTKLPKCSHPCTRQQACGHPTAPHSCHPDNEKCPPCTVLMDKYCMGGHVKRPYVMCHVKVISCGRMCNKEMHCGLHSCTRMCHTGKCEVGSSSSSSSSSNVDNNVSCGQRCKIKRQDCEHGCSELCHPQRPCDDNKLCEEMAAIECPCGLIKNSVLCHKRKERELECDEVCRKEKRSRMLAAAFAERKQREESGYLSSSSSSSSSSLSSSLSTSTDETSGKDTGYYPSQLIKAASANIEFAEQIEDAICKLLEESSQAVKNRYKGLTSSAEFKAISTPGSPSPSMEPEKVFPPMDIEQRKFVHELAGCYGLDSKSFNKLDVTQTGEPIACLRKFVIVKVKKEYWEKEGATVPSVSLCSIAKKNIERQNSGWADWGCVMKICDLNNTVKTEHLIGFLSPFEGEYTLKWVDDKSCLVFFDDPTRVDAALALLGKEGSMFTIKKVSSGDDIGTSKNINIKDKKDDVTSPNTNNNWRNKEGPEWLRERQEMKKQGSTGLLSDNVLLERRKNNQGSSSQKNGRPQLQEPWKAPISNPWNLLSVQSPVEQKTKKNEPVRDSWLSLVEDEENTKLVGPNGEWPCSACTYLNKLGTNRCSICDTPSYA